MEELEMLEATLKVSKTVADAEMIKAAAALLGACKDSPATREKARQFVDKLLDRLLEE